METIKNLFNYFFQPYPGTFFQYYILFIIIAVLFIGAGVYAKLYIKQNKKDKPLRRLLSIYPSQWITAGVCLGIYLFFRANSIPYLSSRFLLAIIMILGVYSVMKAARIYTQKYPLEKKKFEELQKKNKYVVKKKK